ncbi:ShlB/FhaC/HecB family hemolysin secretion/activation protein [Noviherbaspirillum saxi]|uniref:ShlB/FhaC/HecB family hemolysin secretion/activation protein n=1 Tax=Noviherbaspirillum saxi TaxID=2320863 RepID=A0A3A3FTU8_9BURK|nr:ShlB/FhaC/HecB family hemolysin secretion/activation protein [Noviherbaspirillum saxi]RJF99223.1 ShlB/FhaC/HecB family hemolysin secretion/activation protein [Noviherbaspirillum saxi]
MNKFLPRRVIAGSVLLVLAIAAIAAEESDAIGRFEITRYEVTGNTLLDPSTIDTLLIPFTGKARNFGDVQRALETLEAAYHALGYNVVQVALPEQVLKQGEVRLHVIQTRLGKVRVEGNKAFDDANIRRSVPGLREGESPNIAQISSSLKLANENPAKKTTLQLQSGDRDDEVNAVLKVEDDKPWRIAATLDNSGNKSTGETQLATQFQYANVAGTDQVLSLQYTTTLERPSQVSVYGVGYHVPLYALGDSIDLFASYSDVDSGSVLAGIFNLQVSGRGTVMGARYNQNLRRAGNYESRIVYGLDYKDYKNNVALSGVQLGNDVTVHPLSIAYGGNWSDGRSEMVFSLTGMRNIPGGDRGGSADFARLRAGAPAAYSILRYNAGYARSLSNDWQVKVALSGQYTRDALVPGEQFGAGGAGTVRGFHERDVSNDEGRLISAELYTPNLCGSIQSVATQCRALAFYDAAHLSRNNALPGEDAKASIGSIGLGFRLGMSKHLTMQMDYGHVVDGGVTQIKGDGRLHIRLGLTY